MKRKIAIFILLIAVSSGMIAPAQNKLDKKERTEAVKTITRDYSDWSRCTIDGKLKTNLLPISPSLKIFMQKGKQLTISVRAPFVGEVGRLECSDDSLLLVDKLNKRYACEGFKNSDILSDSRQVGELLTQIQQLLLSRVVLIGNGVLSNKNSAKFDFYSDNAGGWLAVPGKDNQYSRLSYGYMLSDNGRIRAIVLDASEMGYLLTMQYEYPKTDTQIDFDIQGKNKQYQAQLTLNAPKFGGEPLTPFTAKKSYKRVTIAEFLKSLKS